MICLAVRLLVKPGTEERVAELFRAASVESRKEPGCIMYLVHQQKDDARRFLVYEQYKDEAALDAHRKSPHFKQFVADGIYTMVESREAELYEPI